STDVDDGSTRVDRGLGEARALNSDELLPALLDAIDQITKYARPKVLPRIVRVAHSELEAMVCPGKCGVLASYRPGEGIYLDNRLSPETSLFDRSVVLHELVHYLQDLHNERSDMRPCQRWYFRELEAYAIQKQFLTLVGSPTRVAYSAAKSTCDDENGPQTEAVDRH
ncbi:MAG: hypothetical protein ACREUQ_07245, partial [Burkholderiales bacterium]